MKLFICLFSSVFLFIPSFSTKLWTNPENDSLIDSSNRSAGDDAHLGNVLPSENADDFMAIPIKTDHLIDETTKFRKSVRMTSKSSTKVLTSDVWAYFEQIPNIPIAKAKCTECGKEIQMSPGYTSNLRRHLQGKHQLLLI
ncbi:hypothetical protein niasHT_015114 [Heterodera trifolii]|uniref:BED-type domain-containing protein n=1 Tax=Heterodera trifolii TaxID=157864 RepID=A0ABD2L9M5_9BILA